ncbi:MAG: trimeric intracellular cation channel family protein [Lentisphaeria bacterium]|nr:trimeric intracellular cation channel family protein [Lentisphaeria bacterium]
MEETFIYIADLAGTIIFAVTGAIKGISRKLDLLGVVVLSCTVGVGGGIFRDCVTGALPAAALRNEIYLLLCILTALSVFCFAGKVSSSRAAPLIIYLDAVGLGVFTAIGCAKALALGLPPVTVVLAGVITACGGGVVRDIFVSSIPAVLKSDFYATASLFGGILYLILVRFSFSVFTIFLCVSLFVTALRLLAYRYKVQLPKSETKIPSK